MIDTGVILFTTRWRRAYIDLHLCVDGFKAHSAGLVSSCVIRDWLIKTRRSFMWLLT